MIGTSSSAYAPMRVKCIQRWRFARSWSSPPPRSAGVVNSSLVAMVQDQASSPDRLRRSMATYDRLAELPIEMEAYELEGLEREVSREFTRLTTVIRIRGRDQEGLGEDVTYDALDHIALQDAGAVHDLTGARTFGDLCELVEGLDLFPSPPVRDVSRLYRQWAFESSALDLALRQAGVSLAQRVGR